MLHDTQADAGQIHHLAADQVCAVEILLVPLRQIQRGARGSWRPASAIA